MPKNGNSKLKRAVRARMAETGENYTTALRRVREQERDGKEPFESDEEAADA